PAPCAHLYPPPPTPLPPPSTLFPYTTLFRSLREHGSRRLGRRRALRGPGRGAPRTRLRRAIRGQGPCVSQPLRAPAHGAGLEARSEEHTSELQSHLNLVCRLLLAKTRMEHLL